MATKMNNAVYASAQNAAQQSTLRQEAINIISNAAKAALEEYFVSPLEKIEANKLSLETLHFVDPNKVAAVTTVEEVAQPLFNVAFEQILLRAAEEVLSFDELLMEFRRAQGFWARATKYLAADMCRTISNGFKACANNASAQRKAYKLYKSLCKQMGL